MDSFLSLGLRMVHAQAGLSGEPRKILGALYAVKRLE